MQEETFIKAIEEEFEDIKPETIKADTVFRQLEGWSSMMALILIAKIDMVYSVSISADELAACTTINDLYQLTTSKMAA